MFLITVCDDRKVFTKMSITVCGVAILQQSFISCFTKKHKIRSLSHLYIILRITLTLRYDRKHKGRRSITIINYNLNEAFVFVKHKIWKDCWTKAIDILDDPWSSILTYFSTRIKNLLLCPSSKSASLLVSRMIVNFHPFVWNTSSTNEIIKNPLLGALILNLGKMSNIQCSEGLPVGSTYFFPEHSTLLKFWLNMCLTVDSLQ